MDASALHTAMAALLGASFIAVSALFMHCKTIAQLRELTKTIERDREAKKDSAEYDLAPPIDQRGQSSNRRQRSMGVDRRASLSLPDLTTISEDPVGEPGRARETSAAVLAVDGVPLGLGRLRTPPVGNSANSVSLNRRASYFGRPISPKSPVALESIEESDDEDDMHSGAVVMPRAASMVTFVAPGENGDKKQISLSTASLIRSQSMAADILRKEPEQETFVKLKIPSEPPAPEEVDSYMILQECLELRQSYIFRDTVAPWDKEVITNSGTPKSDPNPFHYSPEEKSEHFYQMEDGVVQVYANKDAKDKMFHVADASTFFTDLHHILRVMADGNVRTLCYNRLGLLEQKSSLHLMLNADREFLAQKCAPHRDFYNVRKVDTHVHHSACMNQKHLLRFIKSKLKKEPDQVVISRDGTHLTLKEVFESLDLTGYDLNVDLMDVHADKSTFHRFDNFNLKYNPCGQSRLREIFLKQDNFIQGRYLAELTKEVFSDLTASKYQMAEYRISIYGRKQSEWDTLASWIVNHDLHAENVVWLIQIPRLYNIYKDMGIVTSFQDLLDNIFLPLFEVTVNPNSHPHLHLFLNKVVGMDLVDDESKPERRVRKHMPTPSEWTNVYNPAFSYYTYYCYANLYTLNKLRESKGLTTIKLRPHAGEAGDIDHLAATFLTSHSISHGINLRKSPVLQYLYYLAQIGLAVSPLSNNSLFLDYQRNPFPTFFLRGLNVSLSTDDPLQIHFTREPLVEEYSIAASVWKLSSCDLCEIARNSVLQSGFSHALKSHWIGSEYYRRGPEGNNIRKTNVPYIRLEFRHTTWKEEMQHLYLGKAYIPEEIDN